MSKVSRQINWRLSSGTARRLVDGGTEPRYRNDLALAARELDLIFLDKPNRLASGGGKPSPAIMSATNQDRLANVTLGDAGLLKEGSNSSPNAFNDLQMRHCEQHPQQQVSKQARR